MNDINRVYLIGRLTADPELKTISGGSQVCSFSIANNRSYTRQNGESVEEVSYFNCTVWGKLGEILHRYAGKGKQIAVEGRLRQRRWQGPDGKNQSAVDIVVGNFQFLGSRTEGGAPESRPQQQPARSSSYQPDPAEAQYGGYDAGYDGTEEDIPF